MTYEENLNNLIQEFIENKDETRRRTGYEIPEYMKQENANCGNFYFGTINEQNCRDAQNQAARASTLTKGTPEAPQ